MKHNNNKRFTFDIFISYLDEEQFKRQNDSTKKLINSLYFIEYYC